MTEEVTDDDKCCCICRKVLFIDGIIFEEGYMKTLLLVIFFFVWISSLVIYFKIDSDRFEKEVRDTIRLIEEEDNCTEYTDINNNK